MQQESRLIPSQKTQNLFELKIVLLDDLKSINYKYEKNQCVDVGVCVLCDLFG